MYYAAGITKVESSLAFYDKVVDIWYKFLASVRSDANLAENVGKAQLSEGMDMLTRVLNTRVNLLGDTHIATVREWPCVMFTLARLNKKSAMA